MHEEIRVRGARQNSLKNVDVDIPKHQLVVVTGVSGSGKSSLVFDTIAAESARQLSETFPAFVQSRMPSYAHPDVDVLENLPAVIIVDQKRLHGGPRSTVGTISDIGARLRLLYSRIAEPVAGFSNAYGFNDPAGMCPRCEGLGVTARVAESRMVDDSKSLNDGAIDFPMFAPGQWMWKAYAKSGFFDPAMKIGDYTQEQRWILLHAPAGELQAPAGIDAVGSAYEGVIARFNRIYLRREPDSFKGAQREAFERIVERGVCTDCGGTRLSEAVRGSRVGELSIADCNAMQISDLAEFVSTLDVPAVAPLIDSLRVHLDRMVTVGLGYLSMERATSTLSGGEAQRIKIVRHLGSALADMLYVFDEPTVGLHPRDVAALGGLLGELRDRGNTVLVVEHDPDIMAIADHIIDMGPGAGAAGGTIVYQGDYPGLSGADTATGRGLAKPHPSVRERREPRGWIDITGASTHNLRNVDTRIPRGVMTAVTGVAGSGKSSLILGHLPQAEPDTAVIDQRPIRGSRRSNPATFTGMLDPIRRLFAKTTGKPIGLFTANSTGGCTECDGNGVIYTDLAFMDGVLTSCDACGGRQFTPESQAITIDGVSIADVYQMSIAEALAWFRPRPIVTILETIRDVGLDYLTLGQPLTSLSGGERQRLKLAAHLGTPGHTIVLDEPTSGLHIADTERLIALLDRLVDQGSTLVVIEHNLDVIAAADWIIDLGPDAGHDGGRIIFEGTPETMVEHGSGHTATHLRRTSPEFADYPVFRDQLQTQTT
ncbi:ATP-binding cassette domain-containing protein [Gordonia amarae]|nr:excinuclease ABC subunit UvrA [Gordonia amarae]QHN19755.1 ATP-binding cassette domain-containing protein [Gordonia amarae]QHN24217.1 ATP-binding cassette domain-containing protein [Gordonia amarae]QHN33133.1 ATP-binding cassette domain-containing protein [Gordonia amarae]QHN41858.1 ATP-binding cassette domain-containing protein [Gordonia amarae]